MPYVVEGGDGRFVVVEERVAGELQFYYNPIPWLFPPADDDDEEGDILPEPSTVQRFPLEAPLEVVTSIASRSVRARIDGGASDDSPQDISDLLKRWPAALLADRERRLSTVYKLAVALPLESDKAAAAPTEAAVLFDLLREAPGIQGVVPDDILQDDVALVLSEMAKPSTPPRFAALTPQTAMAKLQTPPPLHGFDMQGHLAPELIAELRRGRKHSTAAWGMVQNIKACIEYIADEIAVSYPALKKQKIQNLKIEWEALPATVSPAADLIRRTSEICADHADRILVHIPLEMRIQQAPAQAPLVGTQELERLNTATNIYTFLSLDPAREIGGADYLLMMLDGEHGDDKDEEGNSIITEKSTIGRRLTAMFCPDMTDAVKIAHYRANCVRRLIGNLKEPFAFEMYRAIHLYAIQENKDFVLDFSLIAVEAEKILWAAARFMIEHLNLFRTKNGAVFQRTETAYKKVATVANFLMKIVFKDPLLKPFREYLNRDRAYTAGKGWEGADKVGMAMGFDDDWWPPTELDKNWYSTPDGLYDKARRKFYRKGTPEYDTHAPRVTPYVHFEHEGMWEGDGVTKADGTSTTPNFDSIFSLQGVEANVQKLIMGLLARSTYEVGERDSWQGAPFIGGPGGSGKSTLVLMAASWHPADLVASINSDGGGGVGKYEHLIGVNLIIVLEVNDKFGGNGFAETWKLMVEGGRVSLHRLYKSNEETPKWTTPIVHCGTRFFPWGDPERAVSRRVCYLRFIKQLLDEGAADFEKKLGPERLMVLHKCLLEYDYLLEHYKSSLFHSMVKKMAPKCVKDLDDVTADKDPFGEFFEQCLVPAPHPLVKTAADLQTLCSDKAIVKNKTVHHQAKIFDKSIKETSSAVFYALSVNFISFRYESWRSCIKPGAAKRNVSKQDVQDALKIWSARNTERRSDVFLYTDDNKAMLVTEPVETGNQRKRAWVVNARFEAGDSDNEADAPAVSATQEGETTDPTQTTPTRRIDRAVVSSDDLS